MEKEKIIAISFEGSVLKGVEEDERDWRGFVNGSVRNGVFEKLHTLKERGWRVRVFSWRFIDEGIRREVIGWLNDWENGWRRAIVESGGAPPFNCLITSFCEFKSSPGVYDVIVDERALKNFPN